MSIPLSDLSAASTTLTGIVVMKDSTGTGFFDDIKLVNVSGGGGGGGSATITYIHTDHLGGTQITTDSTGAATSTTSYYPYGADRVATGPQDQKTYIGGYRDSETTMSYLNARYYEGSRGQFLSQDPVFWEVGQTADGKSVLTNPQLQNSYSYAGNNPIKDKDPDGRCPVCAAALVYIARGIIVGAGINTGAQYLSDVYTNVDQQGIVPGSFLPRGESAGAYGQGILNAVPLGVAGGIGSGVARGIGVSSLLGNSVGIGVGATLNTFATDPQRSVGNALTEGVTTGVAGFAGGRIIGGVPGRQPNLFTPNFFTGANMRNEIKTGVTSQVFQSGTPSYSSIVAGLSQVVNSLSPYVNSLKGNNEKKK
ncbi:MAG: hypothetical protein RLZZ283_342 [Candidatus Parcubacteria bacterium]